MTSTTEFSTTTWNFTYFASSTYFSSTQSKEEIINPILGALTLLIVGFGAPSNIVSLLYFLKKSGRNTGTIIYRQMNIVDTLICALLIPVGLNYFNDHRYESPFFFNKPALCNLWSALWHIATRLSIYLIGVMSTARAISLLRPLYYLKKSVILTPLVLYILLLILQQTMPYWWGKTPVKYYPQVGICTWTFNDITTIYSTAHKLGDFFFIQLEFLLPVIPIVASTVITMLKLHHKDMELVNQTTIKNRKHATVTIIILSLIFVVLNMPYLIYQFFNSLATLSNGNISLHWDGSLPLMVRKIFLQVYSIHLIGLNSCINSIIYFIRIKELRNHFFSPRKWRQSRHMKAYRSRRKGKECAVSRRFYYMSESMAHETSVMISADESTIDNFCSIARHRNEGRILSTMRVKQAPHGALGNGCSTLTKDQRTTLTTSCWHLENHINDNEFHTKKWYIWRLWVRFDSNYNYIVSKQLLNLSVTFTNNLLWDELYHQGIFRYISFQFNSIRKWLRT